AVMRNGTSNCPIEPGKIYVSVLADVTAVDLQTAGLVGDQYLPVLADIEQVQAPRDMQQVALPAVQIHGIERTVDAGIAAGKPDFSSRPGPRQTRQIAPLAGQPPSLSGEVGH